MNKLTESEVAEIGLEEQKKFVNFLIKFFENPKSFNDSSIAVFFGDDLSYPSRLGVLTGDDIVVNECDFLKNRANDIFLDPSIIYNIMYDDMKTNPIIGKTTLSYFEGKYYENETEDSSQNNIIENNNKVIDNDIERPIMVNNINKNLLLTEEENNNQDVNKQVQIIANDTVSVTTEVKKNKNPNKHNSFDISMFIFFKILSEMNKLGFVATESPCMIEDYIGIPTVHLRGDFSHFECLNSMAFNNCYATSLYGNCSPSCYFYADGSKLNSKSDTLNHSYKFPSLPLLNASLDKENDNKRNFEPLYCDSCGSILIPSYIIPDHPFYSFTPGYGQFVDMRYDSAKNHYENCSIFHKGGRYMNSSAKEIKYVFLIGITCVSTILFIKKWLRTLTNDIELICIFRDPASKKEIYKSILTKSEYEMCEYDERFVSEIKCGFYGKEKKVRNMINKENLENENEVVSISESKSDYEEITTEADEEEDTRESLFNYIIEKLKQDKELKIKITEHKCLTFTHNCSDIFSRFKRQLAKENEDLSTKLNMMIKYAKSVKTNIRTKNIITQLTMNQTSLVYNMKNIVKKNEPKIPILVPKALAPPFSAQLFTQLLSNMSLIFVTRKQWNNIVIFLMNQSSISDFLTTDTIDNKLNKKDDDDEISESENENYVLKMRKNNNNVHSTSDEEDFENKIDFSDIYMEISHKIQSSKINNVFTMETINIKTNMLTKVRNSAQKAMEHQIESILEENKTYMIENTYPIKTFGDKIFLYCIKKIIYDAKTGCLTDIPVFINSIRKSYTPIGGHCKFYCSSYLAHDLNEYQQKIIKIAWNLSRAMAMVEINAEEDIDRKNEDGKIKVVNLQNKVIDKIFQKCLAAQNEKPMFSNIKTGQEIIHSNITAPAFFLRFARSLPKYGMFIAVPSPMTVDDIQKIVTEYLPQIIKNISLIY